MRCIGVRPLPFFILASSFTFLYVPAVLNVVTTGNGTAAKNVLKWNLELGFVFGIQSSVYGATTVAKVSLFSTEVWERLCCSIRLVL